MEFDLGGLCGLFGTLVVAVRRDGDTDGVTFLREDFATARGKHDVGGNGPSHGNSDIG